MLTRQAAKRRRWGVAAGLALCVAAVILVNGCPPRRAARQPSRLLPGQQIRAVWVTRWDYKTPADITAVMENCYRAGFNTVLFQVRGHGTVFYRSRYEVWADELGGRDPGFDPLAIACTEAHRRGMQIQAWVNVMPGWRGKRLPKNPNQLYNAHRDWFWRDAQERYQPLGWYVSVNPCYPEVREYLVGVMQEILAGYPVDGLHLDYIRFPNDTDSVDYPRDPRTLQLFRQATGQHPDAAPRAWADWRTRQVDQLVYEIRRMAKRTRPGALLTVAAGSVFDKARKEHFQDVREWIDKGWLDAVFPMNYTDSVGTFEARLAAWRPIAGRIPVVPGIMFDKRDARTVLAQMDRSSVTGGHFAAFAYNSLFERRDGQGRANMDDQSSSRAQLRNLVIPRIRQMAFGK